MEIEKIEFGALPGFDMIEKLSVARALLKEEVCKIKFTKVDGSEREMVCTLKADLLPEAFESKQPSNRKPVEETGVLPVFLPEQNEWRSFKVDNLISLEVCDEA